MKRTLHETFVANVRVLGCPRLPAHEKTLILEYAIENIINEPRSLHELGQPFGTLVTDESSMLETGGEISKMMNLLQQRIVLNDAKKIFIGDLTPLLSFRNAHHDAWARSILSGHG